MDEFKNYTVTCHTVGCGNSEIAIPVLAPIVDAFFVCGPCGQPIVDVVG